MAKFCGHCGSPMDEDALVCGQCGVPIQGVQIQMQEDFPGKRAGWKKIGWKKIVIPILILLLGIFVFRTVQSRTGAQGLLRKTMRAIQKGDIDRLVNLSSGLFAQSGEIGDLPDHYQSFLEDDLHIEGILMDQYKIKYKSGRITTLSKPQMDKLLSYFSSNSSRLDTSIIKKMAVARVYVEVKDKTGAYLSKNRTSMKYIGIISVVMSKEDGKWKLLGVFGDEGVPVLDRTS